MSQVNVTTIIDTGDFRLVSIAFEEDPLVIQVTLTLDHQGHPKGISAFDFDAMYDDEPKALRGNGSMSRDSAEGWGPEEETWVLAMMLGTKAPATITKDEVLELLFKLGSEAYIAFGLLRHNDESDPRSMFHKG